VRLARKSVVVAALLAAVPYSANAAYCGSAAQTTVIERQSIARGAKHPAFDRTRVMNIMVYRGYAVANIEYAGVLTQYFKQYGEQWRFDGYTLPVGMPTAVARKFQRLPPSPTVCGNPHFVNHPSG
jgi:hypothetical protein